MYVATGRDLTELVRPPRSLFVNHPMGNNFGSAGDTHTQADVLRRALLMIHGVGKGGLLADYPTHWETPFQFAPGGTGVAATA